MSKLPAVSNDEQAVAKAVSKVDYSDFDGHVRELDRIRACYAVLSNLADKAKRLSPSAAIDMLGSYISRYQHTLKTAPEVVDLLEDDSRFLSGEITHKSEVSEYIAVLLGSFPAQNVPNPKVYTRMLVEEVAAATGDRLVLDSACRRARRTMKTVPSIAAFLALIEEEKEKWYARDIATEEFERTLKELKTLQAELQEKKRVQDEAAAKRAQEREERERANREKAERAAILEKERAEEKARQLASNQALIGHCVSSSPFGMGEVIEAQSENLLVRFENRSSPFWVHHTHCVKCISNYEPEHEGWED